MPKAVNQPISILKKNSKPKAFLPQIKNKVHILHKYASENQYKPVENGCQSINCETKYLRALDYKNIPKHLQAYLEVSHKRNNVKPDKTASNNTISLHASEKSKDPLSVSKNEDNSQNEDLLMELV
ncbi:unnamed protein product [Blepharisma stoltei]|uniref:Uncharacterized protein n=1 Tax=Blepharisma stoltei TaxID=1481888 RepID=A0AAU9JV75_9CILI|nr:unnamed protein product [Blepharisma stoltei]